MLTRSRKNQGQNQQQLIQQEKDDGVMKGKKRKYKGMDMECEESGDSYQPFDSDAEENDDISSHEIQGNLNDESSIQEDDEEDDDSDFVNTQGKNGNSNAIKKICVEDKQNDNVSKKDVKKSVSNNKKRQKIRRIREWKLNSIDDDGILKIFSMFDMNGKGYVNSSDVTRIVDELMLGMDYEQQDDMMKRVAEITGGSTNMIEPEQFFTLVNSLRGQQQ